MSEDENWDYSLFSHHSQRVYTGSHFKISHITNESLKITGIHEDKSEPTNPN